MGNVILEMTQPPNMTIIDLSDRVSPVESVERSGLVIVIIGFMSVNSVTGQASQNLRMHTPDYKTLTKTVNQDSRRESPGYHQTLRALEVH